jgi:hypothetical protein
MIWSETREREREREKSKNANDENRRQHHYDFGQVCTHARMLVVCAFVYGGTESCSENINVLWRDKRRMRTARGG